ncbi:hypothetical protein KC19_2G049700 [Ceratodon purpureus]|uniref:Uncharacterized protein n=1 Tax=Ceratodon purpureus TaxID=3225 RepID=A0A8T0IT26_CERPU|nr:hypothetical protein KC19_2G049700 [Ceratodon purpureus]
MSYLFLVLPFRRTRNFTTNAILVWMKVHNTLKVSKYVTVTKITFGVHEGFRSCSNLSIKLQTYISPTNQGPTTHANSKPPDLHRRTCHKNSRNDPLRVSSRASSRNVPLLPPPRVLHSQHRNPKPSPPFSRPPELPFAWRLWLERGTKGREFGAAILQNDPTPHMARIPSPVHSTLPISLHSRPKMHQQLATSIHLNGMCATQEYGGWKSERHRLFLRK